MPALPLLLLFHSRWICIVYVTTVLVRHWAVQYQQMTRNQRNQSKKIERFVVLYRDGEVVEAVLTCSFFFGTVVYGVRNQDSWGNVERLQFLVWAVISGVTCSLVAILGQRVHANMKSVSCSDLMIDHVRRVYYVAVGSSLLWCQCTVCFALSAALDRPLSAKAWLLVNCGINVTGFGVAILYYLIIGCKSAARAANALAAEAARLPGSGVEQFQHTIRQIVKMVTSGASTLKVGVGVLSDHLVTDISVKRVHMAGDDERTESEAWSSTGEDWLGTGGAVEGKIKCDALEPFDGEIGGDDLLAEFKLDSGRGVVEEESRARKLLPRPVSPKTAQGVLESDPWESGIEEGVVGKKSLEKELTPGEPKVEEPEPSSSERNNRLDKKHWKIVEFDSASEGEALSHRSVYGDDSRGSSAHSGSVGQGNRKSSVHSRRGEGRLSASARGRNRDEDSNPRARSSSGEEYRAGSGSKSAGTSQPSDEEELAGFRERSGSASASGSGSRSVKRSRSTSGAPSYSSSENLA